MHDVSERTKRKSTSIMLTNDVSTFYRNHMSKVNDYNEVIRNLDDEHNTAEKRNGVQEMWHSVSLSTEMKDKPEESEPVVFQNMRTKISKYQRQVSAICHNDENLMNILINACNSTRIQ